ncbi:uncharacterized protein LOC111519150 [Drosophila willistoni]|uniref:uncharacterized protein LOC111519150 n=1 Tax=Drosophila willistoni TaxID=7260 RepID=UPI000C26CED8|nr:uncharacterized protein LOC111519150 [Drosophila willistoni]
MCSKYSALIGIFILAFQIVQITSLAELTNLKCNSLDETFAAIEYCRIKSVNRTYKYFSVKVGLFKIPISNVTINLAAFQRLNGYKPFLYNITFDACKYLASTNKNPIVKYFHEFIIPYTNLNHTCPYNHDMIVEKVPIDFINNRLTQVLPFPLGDYALHTDMYYHGINRLKFKIYLSLK